MRLRVLDAADAAGRAAWTALWEAWPAREVMAHPEFALLFLRPGDRAVAVVGEEGDARVLFPLVLRPLAAEPWAAPDERRWDAATPYGYGGPFAWGAPRDDAAFWRAFEAFCAEARIVTTFARLSLFPEALAALPPSARVEERQPNVVVPLAGGEDAVWRGYDGQVRRWVRAAEAAGVSIEVDRAGAGLDAFHGIYTHTMERRRAEGWYFLPRALFDALFARLAGHVVLFHARRAGEIVSSDLVLVSADHVTYFLGGTLEAAFPHGPNYLLKHHVARWAIAEGKRAYVLGGGYAAGDTLQRYKRAYARHGVVPFRTASFVHDEAACRDLSLRRAAAAAREGAAWAPRPGWFPAYRG